MATGVGRFQVMATLQAARARILGLSVASAKSWGLNRAIFYAAAKRGFKAAQGAGPAKPKGVRARIDSSSWPRPPIFDFLQRHGEISEDEMRRVFNLGLGMVLVIRRDQASDVIDRFAALGERAYRIGVIEKKAEDEAGVLFEDAPPRSR